jgi:prepilin-type N-terminal cleavage/methylation domain-containing protein
VNRSKDQGDQGFTLVEMLVVLAITGLMSGLMLVLMGQFRSIIRADSLISEQSVLQKTVNHIAMQVEQAQALPLELNQDSPFKFIESQGNALRFLAVSHLQDSHSGLFEYSYGIENSNGMAELVEKRRPRRNNTKNTEIKKTVLLDNTDSLSFSFLQTASTNVILQKNVKPNWLMSWQNEPSLPIVIKIKIEKKPKSGNKIQATAIAYMAR